MDISDLPAGDYQLEAMFRVGIHRDCGSAGNGEAAVETSAVYYTYKHRSTHYNNDHFKSCFLAVINYPTTQIWSQLSKDPL